MASSSLMTLFTICWISLLAPVTFAAIKATDDNSAIKISNDRLAFSISKGSGTVSTLSLDGQDLLGSGRGPYLDCHCVADGFWTPGSGGTYKLFRGSDKAGVAYAGAVMSQNYQNTGKTLEQYWFLRDGETGIHSFSRAAYKNTKTPNGGDLGEMRVLFRPSTNLWTHLSSSDDMWGPLPSTSGAPSVQDATWYVGGNKNHPYVKDVSDYFTKYMFSEMWRDTSVHGLFSDGTNSKDGSSFGAWLVMNTKDTYFGGPTHSDLTVDGIVYNYVGK
jgi:rhamnogalacturonan endolyase